MRESVAAIKRHRTARLAKLVGRAYYLHRRGQEQRMYTMICDEFVSLGGVYVKFLQGVLLRSELLKQWDDPRRLQIFENLDHEPLDVTAILRHELKPDQLQKITHIQPQPFAAGSFGQVYYGQHIGGKPIVIKVLRPMIRELLRYDLRLLSAFSKSFVNKTHRNMDYDLNGALADFRAATLRETDYIEEANFARELYEVYKDHPKLIIPETFTDLCTTHIIVQEYIEGISAAQVIKLKEQGVDPKQYIFEEIGSDLDEQLVTLGYESLSGIFNLPRIQGDPHPGNVRLMTNDRVGLIDFGISARTPRNKAAFYGIIKEWSHLYAGKQSIANMFEQFIRFFVSDLYRALKKLSTMRQSPNGDNNFTQEVGKIAQETFSKVTGTADIGALVQDGRIIQIISKVINKENRFGLVVKLEASEILRAAQTYVTLVETLGRRNVVLPRVFSSVVKNVGEDHPSLAHNTDDSMTISDALDTVSSWLERVAERDPALFRELMNRIKLSRQKVDIIKEPGDA